MHKHTYLLYSCITWILQDQSTKGLQWHPNSYMYIHTHVVHAHTHAYTCFYADVQCIHGKIQLAWQMLFGTVWMRWNVILLDKCTLHTLYVTYIFQVIQEQSNHLISAQAQIKSLEVRYACVHMYIYMYVQCHEGIYTCFFMYNIVCRVHIVHVHVCVYARVHVHAHTCYYFVLWSTHIYFILWCSE